MIFLRTERVTWVSHLLYHLLAILDLEILFVKPKMFVRIFLMEYKAFPIRESRIYCSHHPPALQATPQSAQAFSMRGLTKSLQPRMYKRELDEDRVGVGVLEALG